MLATHTNEPDYTHVLAPEKMEIIIKELGDIIKISFCELKDEESLSKRVDGDSALFMLEEYMTGLFLEKEDLMPVSEFIPEFIGFF
jgi:hypothetical protein